ncbi:uncharacterized protein Fot_27380 [Forsythia ovata]|uniref:SAM domain-containing protein n=1 Tax=Forsythia ovata TaxID=205694 RepID=A0ABD1UEN4_9LAMI
MHKRISRHMERGMEEHKKMELHEKVSRAIRSLESPKRSLLKNISPTRRRAGTPLRSSYTSWTLDELRPRFPDRVLRSSSGISAPRNTTDEVQRKQNDASKTEHILTSDLLDPSRSRISLPMISRAHVDAGKLVARPPSSSGGISRGLYPDEQPLTVSGLLHSLGLGKYAIHFQAEEIDMAVSLY